MFKKQIGTLCKTHDSGKKNNPDKNNIVFKIKTHVRPAAID